jgi:hypothetical protein
MLSENDVFKDKLICSKIKKIEIYILIYKKYFKNFSVFT